MSHFRRKEKSELPGIPEHSPSPSLTPKTSYEAPGYNTKSIVSHIKKVQWRLLLISLFFWLVVIHHYERVVVRRAVNLCGWNKWEPWDNDIEPHRLALLADPQILDEFSYPERPRLMNYFVRRISDNYLHRNYRYIQEYLDPDTIIFVGDLFDGGREWKDGQWFDEYKRFNSMFPKKPNRRYITSLPGNHDIGFEEIDLNVKDRFTTFFGEPNDYYELGNHSIVILDTISLSSQQGYSAEGMEFLNTINQKLNPEYPRILFSHVPLYRFNDVQTCGPLREKGGKFPIQRGKQYQTVLEYELSQQILQVIDPTIIFAGDDHDYCQIKQSYVKNGVNRVADEIAIKSNSMTMGIKYPAIQLLSLNNPLDSSNSGNTFSTEMCFMPSPYRALNVYLLTLFMCVAYLITHFFFPQRLQFLYKFLDMKIRKKDLPVYEKSTQWKARDMYSFNSNGTLADFSLHFVLLLSGIYLLFGTYYKFI